MLFATRKLGADSRQQLGQHVQINDRAVELDG
jgi:hypothetical protein